MESFVCSICGNKTDPKKLTYRCRCGGLFNLEFMPNTLDIDKMDFSMWRYISALPFEKDYTGYKSITLGEGMTNTIPLDNDNPDILLKMDFMMPTLSFKDRGAAVLIAKAVEFGAKTLVADSSGNAGNSIAAYAGRAGIACHVFVPQGTSSKKIQMITSHGAKVHIVSGTREDTALAALEMANQDYVFYASHVYNPYFYQGTKTYIYELYEQGMPDSIIIPTGNGTLLLGCYIGICELKALGLISKIPRLIAVQSDNCAPIYKAFKQNTKVEPVENFGTQAEGIAIAMPMRGNQIIQAIKETNGDIITIMESQITPTRDMLARKGLYVEPTTAATVGGFLPYYQAKKNSLGRCVIPLCGAGLKSK